MNRGSFFPERLRSKIENSLLINHGDRVIVALSGGADSVALLCALADLGYDLCAYHLNHGLRGAAADGDERFCRNLCENLGVPFFSEKRNISRYAEELGVSFEDAGRRARYEGLAVVAAGLSGGEAEAGAGRVLVATGHHAGDVAETFFMNVLRGAGLSGLCSIADESERSVPLGGSTEISNFQAAARGSCGDASVTLRIVRPLLDFRKSELIEYLIDRGISWREDATNESDDYFRNRIRKLLNDTYIQKIAGCVQLLKKDRDFLEAHAESLARRFITEKTVNGTKKIFLNLRGSTSDGSCGGAAEALHESEFSRLVRIAVRMLRGDIVDLSRRDVEAVAALGRVGAKLIVAGDVAVYRNYEGLEFCIAQSQDISGFCESVDVPAVSGDFCSAAEGAATIRRLKDVRENPANSVCIEFIPPEEYALKKRGGADRAGYAESSVVIDMKKVAGELRVRSRAEGDVLVPLGMSGHRSLKKLLIDEKIDRRIRDEVPVVVDDEKIVWVAGVRMSELVKVDASSLLGDAALAKLTLVSLLF